jgi:malate synthase
VIESPPGVEVTDWGAPHVPEVLTADALAFVAGLQRAFNDRRAQLLAARVERQARFDAGELPMFLASTAALREDTGWRVAATPPDLDDRRVEITGPAEPKMIINAMNSGARVFMCDFEDALSPTWPNVVTGQWAVREAVRRRLTHRSGAKAYSLREEAATLVVRPRGWHLEEAHVLVDGEPMSASLFDFGLTFFHNAREQLARGSGPYFYLPKLESHQEARLWNDVFIAAQSSVGIRPGSIRATVLIETITAAFEMDEILWELRDHAAGLNAGRWDYIFSIIKKMRSRADFVLPDRAAVTMAVPFMRAYADLLVRTCHQRGAHAMGGMAAFIPSRRDPAVNERAFRAVRADKEREVAAGFDGTWVAHPDLVPVAREVFDAALADRPNQKSRLRDDVAADAASLLDVRVPAASVTADGVRANVGVGLAYLASWLDGNGAAAIENLMEDAATAEISRSQLWQWRTHRVPIDGGAPLTSERYAEVRDRELAALAASPASDRLTDAAALLDELVLSDDFAEFLTLDAYRRHMG